MPHFNSALANFALLPLTTSYSPAQPQFAIVTQPTIPPDMSESGNSTLAIDCPHGPVLLVLAHPYPESCAPATGPSSSLRPPLPFWALAHDEMILPWLLPYVPALSTRTVTTPDGNPVSLITYKPPGISLGTLGLCVLAYPCIQVRVHVYVTRNVRASPGGCLSYQIGPRHSPPSCLPGNRESAAHMHFTSPNITPCVKPAARLPCTLLSPHPWVCGCL